MIRSATASIAATPQRLRAAVVNSTWDSQNSRTSGRATVHTKSSTPRRPWPNADERVFRRNLEDARGEPSTLTKTRSGSSRIYGASATGSRLEETTPPQKQHASSASFSRGSHDFPRRQQSYQSSGDRDERRRPGFVAGKEPFYSKRRTRPPEEDEGAGTSGAWRGKPRYTTDPKPVVLHPLTPFVLMGRLKSLCDGGRLQEAVDMLLNAPLDAKRVKHFNLLMKTASTLAKYSEMYNLFIEMKRRGFIPNAGTYQTMLGGYAQIEDWSHRTKQIAQVHNVFENYRSWVTALKAEDPKSLHLTVGPYNPYFKILGATKQYEKIYDVYYDMDQDGPLSPDVKVLTGLFDALVETKREPGSTQEIRPQNISFAKVVWRNMTKKMEASPEFKLDSHLIRAVLRLFRSGSAADRIFALDVICRDNLGLAKPGETAPPPKVELTEYIVNQVIALCNNSNKFRLSIHFAQQLMDRPLKDGESSILTHYILEDVLYAYCNQETMGSMNEAERALNILDWMIRQNALQYNDNLAPRLITFSRVLEISWRGGDWGVATRTFDLMTGYKAADFADIPADVKRSTPQMERRSPGKNFLPTTIQMCHLVRTALNSGVVANMRQALRIFVHFGGERFFLQGALQNDTLPEVAQTRYLPFYAQTTAETVSGLVKAVLAAADTEQVAGKQEIEQWRNLMTAAGQSLRQATVPTPLLRRPVVEQSRLGTSAQLDREDMVIDSLMSQRTQVSPRRK